MSKKVADSGSRAAAAAAYIPTRVLIGHWVHSSEPEPNQHAVYGILSRDGKLRFKLVPETRDGRPVHGNYPPSRETWVIHEDIVFESYLAGLNRLGMKEYCRERGRQVDAGERPGGPDNAANILKAVDKAEHLCAAAKHERPRNLRWEREKCADRRRAERMEGWASRRASKGGGGGGEAGDAAAAAAAIADEVLGPTPGAGVVKKKRKKHGERRTVYHHDHVSEAAVAAAAAVAADADKPGGGFADSSRDDSMDGSTASSVTDSSADDTKPKVHNGVVYQRSQAGPFAGKLTAKGQVVSINGEDYVEYRVLAKV
ncbi:hypothetical protein LMH87_012279 [Akanthomyces muscarius]|uniref:Uncharacterized protein n=2 Tax=Akanthomyces TaxID=150366 RepID=A0A168J952_CORDF|nr:hypothetical protein LMH87_012279 [Akanthomyces muscarius]KAJ4151589.1 hypothetical protein LMH87_012279 [Akanthomyces muscarius]OAA80149.1 hypothetical protein LEL_03635 [Akanthomyces lecanii RCEF 1005]